MSDPFLLVEPDWASAEPLDVLEQFADLAIVVVHHLLDLAVEGTFARRQAEGLLDFIRTQVAGLLGELMTPFCPECGTSGPPSVMESSRRHEAHQQ